MFERIKFYVFFVKILFWSYKKSMNEFIEAVKKLDDEKFHAAVLMSFFYRDDYNDKNVWRFSYMTYGIDGWDYVYRCLKLELDRRRSEKVSVELDELNNYLIEKSRRAFG